jgi:hypothetical protein
MIKALTTIRPIVMSGLSLGLLAACAAPIETNPVTTTLAPAALPERQVGETFTYLMDSGEEVDSTVTTIEGDRVSWRSSDGEEWTAITPFGGSSAVLWSTTDGDGHQEFTPHPGGLFPLEVGKSLTVSYQGVNSGESFTGRQRCTVSEQARVEVPHGAYDSFVVVCQRGRDLSRPSSTRTYYYAPEVGENVIVITQRERGSTEIGKLVRYASSS